MIVAWNRMLAEEVTGSGWTCFSVNGSEALGVFTLDCTPQRHPSPERPHLPKLKPCSFKQYPPFHPPPNPGKPPSVSVSSPVLGTSYRWDVQYLSFCAGCSHLPLCL